MCEDRSALRMAHGLARFRAIIPPVPGELTAVERFGFVEQTQRLEVLVPAEVSPGRFRQFEAGALLTIGFRDPLLSGVDVSLRLSEFSKMKAGNCLETHVRRHKRSVMGGLVKPLQRLLVATDANQCGAFGARRNWESR